MFLPLILPHNLPHLENRVRRLPHVPQVSMLRFGAENPEEQAKRDDKDGNELVALVKESCLKALKSADLARTPDWDRRRRIRWCTEKEENSDDGPHDNNCNHVNTAVKRVKQLCKSPKPRCNSPARTFRRRSCGNACARREKHCRISSVARVAAVVCFVWLAFSLERL